MNSDFALYLNNLFDSDEDKIRFKNIIKAMLMGLKQTIFLCGKGNNGKTCLLRNIITLFDGKIANLPGYFMKMRKLPKELVGANLALFHEGDFLSDFDTSMSDNFNIMVETQMDPTKELDAEYFNRGNVHVFYFKKVFRTKFVKDEIMDYLNN